MGNKPVLKWLYKNCKQILFPMAVLTVMGAVTAYVGVRFAIASKGVIDTATGELSGSLTEKIGGLALLVLVQLILQVSYSMIDVHVRGRVRITLKKNLFHTLLNKDWQSVCSYHTGELSNRLHSDINVITTGVMDILPNFVSLVFTILLSFITLYSLDPVLAIICLAIGPLIVVSARFYSKRMKTLHKECQATDGVTRSFMQECLQNLLVIKSFSREREMTDRSTELQDINFRCTLKRTKINVLANVLFFIAMTAGYYFALAWCAYKISAGIMTFGTLTAILQLVGRVQTPFKSISGLIPSYFSMLASAERVMEMDALPDEKILHEELPDLEKVYWDMQAIEIRGLSFSYKDEPVFQDADMTIEKGHFVAIGGISGIGKSTLLKLLLGILHPDRGSLELVLSGGRRLKVDKDTRRLFAYVPQGNMILSGSIRENIAFSRENIDEDRIYSAAKTAEIWEFIKTLPDGLDTVLGENGLGLSEGQTQRLAIARAVYHDAPVILLDEATSALDEATEKAVLLNLKALKTKTCIIISHRPAVFSICEQTISISEHRIVQVEQK